MIKLSSKYKIHLLNLLYDIFNRLLFSSKLPACKVKIGDLKNQELTGFFLYDETTLTPTVIGIDKNYPDPAKALLHEMCHIYHRCVLGIRDPRNHPPSFVRILAPRFRKMGYELDPEDIGPGYQEP